MSLESALDEERRAVMALLEGTSVGPPRAASRDPGNRLRAASPSGMTQSPVRSMLDIGDGPHLARNTSIATPTSPKFPVQTVRSMLDTTTPPPPPMTAPVVSNRMPMPTAKLNPEAAFNFGMIPRDDSNALPKRNTQAGRTQPGQRKKGTIASVFASSKSSDFRRSRHNSTSGNLGPRRRMSPSIRSESPAQRKLNTNSLNLMPDPGKYITDSGKVIDMTSAYRRLSDAALLRSNGTLADLPTSKKAAELGESFAPDGSTRLEKDFNGSDDDEEVLESDEDGSSDDEDLDPEKRRGRRRTRRKTGAQGERSPALGDHAARRPKSLLAAAEDERKFVSSTYKVRSLLEPEVTITTPDGEKMSARSPGILPNTNFDMGDASELSTPVDSDTEADVNDIRRAQKMALSISPIHSTPESHRCVRQIIRGEYENLQREAEAGLRRQRMYLVATDLSDEAAYALEWTIGTVLRDGDTLLAVFAVDEEDGTGGEAAGVGIGEAAAMMNDTAKIVRTLTHNQQRTGRSLTPGPSPLSNVSNGDDQKPDFSAMAKPEKERWHAAEEVSNRCVKLLKKTRLQVRVVVEVFHCKSPKHMITEVIDYLDPTLVILGSRGRSALKGVLLGSFSNYLVTKSSVPVMVARKRLRKHSKYKRGNLRLANVLTSPRGKLELAKID